MKSHDAISCIEQELKSPERGTSYFIYLQDLSTKLSKMPEIRVWDKCGVSESENSGKVVGLN